MPDYPLAQSDLCSRTIWNCSLGGSGWHSLAFIWGMVAGCGEWVVRQGMPETVPKNCGVAGSLGVFQTPLLLVPHLPIPLPQIFSTFCFLLRLIWCWSQWQSHRAGWEEINGMGIMCKGSHYRVLNLVNQKGAECPKSRGQDLGRLKNQAVSLWCPDSRGMNIRKANSTFDVNTKASVIVTAAIPAPQSSPEPEPLTKLVVERQWF